MRYVVENSGDVTVDFYLPYHHPPYLLIAPQVWDHLNVEKVFGICDAGKNGGRDDAEKKVFGDGGRGKTRGEHADWRVDRERRESPRPKLKIKRAGECDSMHGNDIQVD